jgi:hypothetical protein
MAAFVTTIVGLIPAAAIFIASLVAAIFSVRLGAIGYTAAIYAGLTVIMVSCACVRAPDDRTGIRRLLLSSEEEQLFKKHYAFFRFPFGTQNFAHFVNFARIFGFLWIFVGLWQGIYWVVGGLVVFYLISGPVIMWLMPIAHYLAVAEKGHEFGVTKLAQFEHILENRDSLGF